MDIDINNQKELKTKCLELKLDIKDKIKNYKGFILSNRSKQCPDDKLLISYIIDNNLIEYKCKKCNQGSIWNKKPLQLVLDRMNNIITDNTLENLRFLCPNCFSQLRKRYSIFNRTVKNKQDICIDCNKKIKVQSISYKNIKTKVMRCKECLNKSIFTE